MKKPFTIVLCMALALSLLMVTVGTASAVAPGYDIVEQWGSQTVTIDGKWTNPAEWQDTSVQYIGTPQKGLFEYKVTSPDNYVTIYMQFLLEFADNTNDAGDRWQFCFGPGGESANAPTAGDNKFEIEGHTNIKRYAGNGTGWILTSNPTDVTWKDSVATSPQNSATHYILELTFDKMVYSWGSGYPPYLIRVAMYDASNSAQGWVSWPPTSTDTNPSGWGQVASVNFDPIPENLTVGLMLTLSFVAVLLSLGYFRKSPKL